MDMFIYLCSHFRWILDRLARWRARLYACIFYSCSLVSIQRSFLKALCIVECNAQLMIASPNFESGAPPFVPGSKSRDYFMTWIENKKIPASGLDRGDRNGRVARPGDGVQLPCSCCWQIYLATVRVREASKVCYALIVEWFQIPCCHA